MRAWKERFYLLSLLSTSGRRNILWRKRPQCSSVGIPAYFLKSIKKYTWKNKKNDKYSIAFKFSTILQSYSMLIKNSTFTHLFLAICFCNDNGGMIVCIYTSYLFTNKKQNWPTSIQRFQCTEIKANTWWRQGVISFLRPTSGFLKTYTHFFGSDWYVISRKML